MNNKYKTVNLSRDEKLHLFDTRVGTSASEGEGLFFYKKVQSPQSPPSPKEAVAIVLTIYYIYIKMIA